MDIPDDYLDYADEYRKEHPNANNAEVRAEYLKTNQGKQAMNTRLLGVELHYDMHWGWDIEQSRSKGWVIRKLV